jgi:hypothetical protein
VSNLNAYIAPSTSTTSGYTSGYRAYYYLRVLDAYEKAYQSTPEEETSNDEDYYNDDSSSSDR